MTHFESGSPKTWPAVFVPTMVASLFSFANPVMVSRRWRYVD